MANTTATAASIDFINSTWHELKTVETMSKKPTWQNIKKMHEDQLLLDQGLEPEATSSETEMPKYYWQLVENAKKWSSSN